jgi:hypothetical protein
LSFKTYYEKSKEYLNQLSSYLTGNNSAPNLKLDINPSKELNALHNVCSADQLIQLSNAFYDQVAAKRSLNEIYKKPKDYLLEYKTSIESQIKNLDFMDSDIDDQLESVANNSLWSQSIRSISSNLQLKLSLIKDNTDA